jgi:hypothetical protein
MNESNGGSDNIGWVLSARAAEHHLLHQDNPDHDPNQHDHNSAEAVLKSSIPHPLGTGCEVGATLG